MASTAIAESEVSPTDAVEISTSQLAPSEHAPASPSAAPTSPSSSVSPHDVRETPTAPVSVKPAGPEPSATVEPTVQPISTAVPTSTTSDSAVSATTSVTAPAAVPTGVTTPTIGGLMQVGIGLPPNGTPIDDIVAAQVEWYMSRANLPTDNFLKSHMDSDLWVSLELILTFPRMVRLGVRDKGGVAILLQARSTDIEVDTKTCRIRPAWALRSHLLIRGVPHSATEADLAALLRIPYVAPPAPDTTATSVTSPSADPGSTTTSDSAPGTLTPSTTDAPHFRGLMSVMQVSMAGEWIAAFSARDDAAAALPHVTGQIVCGQPITAEVFIEGLEPHAVPAPSAIYQGVPNYYSHSQTQQAIPHIQSHHHAHAPPPMSSVMPPSSTVDLSHPNSYQHLTYSHSPRSHAMSQMPPYAPYGGGRARAVSENGDGDDLRPHYGQNHGHGHWQRMNGHRVNGQRRGGTGAYPSNHSGYHTSAMRGSNAPSSHNDRSRSPSAMSSLSATNATTNRRPRRTARRPTRRGSPSDGQPSHFNSHSYGHIHGQPSYSQGMSHANGTGIPDSNGNDDANPGSMSVGSPIPGRLIHSSGLVRSTDEAPLSSSMIYERHGVGKNGLSSSAAIVSGGANVAAMNFPPLQPSITPSSRTSSVRGASKTGSSNLSRSGSSEIAVERKASTDTGTNDRNSVALALNEEPQRVSTEVSLSGDENGLSKSDKAEEVDTPDESSTKGQTFGPHFSEKNTSGSEPISLPIVNGPSDERQVRNIAEVPSASANEVPKENETTHGIPVDCRDDDREQNRVTRPMEKAVTTLTAQATSGDDERTETVHFANRIDRINSGTIVVGAQALSNGSVRKAPLGNVAPATKSYAAILLSPPRTPRKESGRQSGNFKSGAKFGHRNSKSEEISGGKVSGKALTLDNNVNGGHIDGQKSNDSNERNGSGNNSVVGAGVKGTSVETSQESAGSSDSARQTKGVRRPPRSPSVWAHKPASVVKAGPVVSSSVTHGSSHGKNGRRASADLVGNGSNSRFRPHSTRGHSHTNGGTHAYANGGHRPTPASQGLQQQHVKNNALSQAQSRSQGSNQSQSSGPAQAPASQARTVVG